MVTPSIGIEQPGCTFWEPAFGQDLEWTFLHALSRLGRADGEAAYFRLSTRPIDQSLQNGTREEVLSGGYRLRPADDPRVVIAVMGALVPEAIEAADILRDEAGAEAEVVCITSADLLYRSFQARAGLAEGDPATLDRLFPHDAPSSRCSTATRTRCRSSATSASGSSSSASQATSRSSTSTTRSTPNRWSEPRST